MGHQYVKPLPVDYSTLPFLASHTFLLQQLEVIQDIEVPGIIKIPPAINIIDDTQS